MKFQKDITLLLPARILDELKHCVNNASPNEACGFVFGDIEEIKLSDGSGYQYCYVAKKFKCFESNKKSTVAFLINNFEEFNNVFRQAAEEFGLKLISVFHSHPSGSHPSGTDTNHMKFLDNCGLSSFKYLVWIIIDAYNKELNGFIYFNKEVMEVAIKIEH